MNVVEQMLQRYPQDSNEARAHALREVMQEIALAGLYRGGFFDVAAFYGGTCLRIFHALPRFSEDLDFSLLQPNAGFALEPYFDAMQEEFAAFGFEVEISAKPKAATSDIASAFLKKTASVYDLRIAGTKLIKIKFEVDTDPPLGFVHEEQLLLQPYSFYVKCFALPDLFAGKMHALLFRRWKNRVKGRDWFDFEWYVRRGCPLNLEHFTERARQSGDLDGAVLSEEAFLGMLEARIRSLDVDSARQDVARFIKTQAQLDIWSQDYFLQLARMIRFQ
ncbi:nucleotidyl transferase AbiEii/AbiGii toxin family protein [Pseudomonas sp. OIL-1]|uniref:nucleotidyl transferase AbiEii/AbiGii toxin family protein n=1 Tax=Pseudomonas sp. OIL-1 TaxID=2706126 RepID=UPI0013A721B5|nr:nucleotidyl transferase AbiEii/AbiGii toxin family protein [Pseudomonas sp. OIL-1]QIB52627.1 nucleotidyl transferase AbiEii/AbiGii toxin family protein [Pseudomonas sp. OIL-1]